MFEQLRMEDGGEGRHQHERVVGEYVLEQEAGHGTFGTVYRAHHRSTPDAPVAIKVATEGHGGHLRAAAAVQSRLSHPGIVKVFDHDPSATPAYLVMEWVDGPSLLSHDGTIWHPDRAVGDVIQPLLSALIAAHDRGIVHGDIKPANILLPEDQPGIKLTDFGLASQLQGGGLSSLQASLSSQQGRIAGTLAYMAPEQMEGQVPDERADLYSVGVILFELLMGRRPTAGDRLALEHTHACERGLADFFGALCCPLDNRTRSTRQAHLELQELMDPRAVSLSFGAGGGDRVSLEGYRLAVGHQHYDLRTMFNAGVHEHVPLLAGGMDLFMLWYLLLTIILLVAAGFGSQVLLAEPRRLVYVFATLLTLGGLLISGLQRHFRDKYHRGELGFTALVLLNARRPLRGGAQTRRQVLTREGMSEFIKDAGTSLVHELLDAEKPHPRVFAPVEEILGVRYAEERRREKFLQRFREVWVDMLDERVSVEQLTSAPSRRPPDVESGEKLTTQRVAERVRRISSWRPAPEVTIRVRLRGNTRADAHRKAELLKAGIERFWSADS